MHQIANCSRTMTHLLLAEDIWRFFFFFLLFRCGALSTNYTRTRPPTSSAIIHGARSSTLLLFVYLEGASAGTTTTSTTTLLYVGMWLQNLAALFLEDPSRISIFLARIDRDTVHNGKTQSTRNLASSLSLYFPPLEDGSYRYTEFSTNHCRSLNAS